MTTLHTADVPDVERRILGAALADEVAASVLFAALSSSRFLDADCGRIARIAERLMAAGQPVNEDTVRAEGATPDALAELGFMATDEATIRFHADLLNRAYLARSLQRLFGQATAEADLCALGDGDPEELASRIARRATEAALAIHQGTPDGTHIRFAVAEALEEADAWQRGETPDLVPTGFYSLDRAIGGYPRGELVTLAGMTGSGKTAAVLQVLRAAAIRQAKRTESGLQQAPDTVVLFSAEMPRNQIVHRVAQAISGVNARLLRQGKGTAEDFAFYRRALHYAAELEIHIEDDPAPSLDYLHARLQQIRLASPSGRVELVAVDYDEKIRAEGDGSEARLAAVAEGLKVIAKRNDTVVLMLSQYNRQACATQLPSNDWLRASGKKEHESAMILHWHHPKYWIDKGAAPDTVPLYNEFAPDAGQVIITKNRFGPTCKTRIDFEPETQRFVDPAEPAEPAPF